MIYKALSLWQPHAQAIALGIKPYETRGWKTDYRGPLAIHAAKKIFREKDYGFAYCQEVGMRFKAVGFPIFALDYGRVICVVDVVDCVRVAEVRGKIGKAEFWGDFRDVGDDRNPRYAIKVENVRLIPANKRPLAIGRQGFFKVELPEGLL
jgi:hypothetical protein